LLHVEVECFLEVLHADHCVQIAHVSSPKLHKLRNIGRRLRCGTNTLSGKPDSACTSESLGRCEKSPRGSCTCSSARCYSRPKNQRRQLTTGEHSDGGKSLYHPAQRCRR